jgi:hypothetical protein
MLIWAEGLRSHDDRLPLGPEVSLLDNRGSIGPDHAADGHEETEDAVSQRSTKARESWIIPEGSTGAQHVLAERPHDAVRASAVAEDIDRPCAKRG